ncbi:MAG: hypothetical protein KF712_11445 [Akkermansiaceae bacterium]|nr:hypothetical protein [Akkermansiaceae bacterium]
MPFAIELRFDPESERRILEIWQEAARLYGTTYLTDHGVIPHLTLVTGDAGLRDAFGQLESPAGVISLHGTGFFAGGNVTFLKPEISEEIHRFHAAVCRIASDLGVPVDFHYLPENWVPHCTIAIDCTRNLEIPISSHLLEASIHSLILVEYPPTRLIAEKTTQST